MYIVILVQDMQSILPPLYQFWFVLQELYCLFCQSFDLSSLCTARQVAPPRQTICHPVVGPVTGDILYAAICMTHHITYSYYIYPVAIVTIYGCLNNSDCTSRLNWFISLPTKDTFLYSI